jgi:YHS domain-containing protein
VTRRLLSLMIVAALMLSIGASVRAEKDTDTVVCSVCGLLIPKSKASTIGHEGKTYYFCEAGCKAYFIANTETVASGKTFDPVCGMVIHKDKAVTATHNGSEAYFCSAACRDKYMADPAAYELGYDVVANELMPVREMKHTAEYEGRTFYFASEENKKRFEADPDAYIWAECALGGDVFLRKDAYAKREYKGHTYYFGCKGCLEAFEKNPAAFVDGVYRGDHTCTRASGEGCPLKNGKSAGCPNLDKHKNCPHDKKASGAETKKS